MVPREDLVETVQHMLDALRSSVSAQGGVNPTVVVFSEKFTDRDYAKSLVTGFVDLMPKYVREVGPDSLGIPESAVMEIIPMESDWPSRLEDILGATARTEDAYAIITVRTVQATLQSPDLVDDRPTQDAVLAVLEDAHGVEGWLLLYEHTPGLTEFGGVLSLGQILTPRPSHIKHLPTLH